MRYVFIHIKHHTKICRWYLLVVILKIDIKYTQFNEKQAALYESIRITMEAKVREAIAQKGLAKSHIMSTLR
jgi:hypothetical protein